MRKLSTLLTLTVLLASNCAFAQTESLQASCDGPCVKKCQTTSTSSKRDVRQQPAPTQKQEFAWGIGLCGLIVVGAVAGITAGMASQSN